MTYPHCDSEVLHEPGLCKFCDLHPELQEYRVKNKINFTGQNDPTKSSDPATKRRSIEKINSWYGNIPWDEKQDREWEEYKQEINKYIGDDGVQWQVDTMDADYVSLGRLKEILSKLLNFVTRKPNSGSPNTKKN